MEGEKNPYQEYRDALTEQLKQTPKQDRESVLETAKTSEDYWQARGVKIEERQDGEEVDGGLGVFVKKKTLYHGTGVGNIKSFTEAEEYTVGAGAYFTSASKDAIGYARRRSKQRKEGAPVIYESIVENMKFLDLRKKENLQKILEGFKEVLLEKINEPGLDARYKRRLQISVDDISSGRVKNLTEVTFNNGRLFSKYVETLGYGGLITFEGGEGDDIGEHDTYLVFDPAKVKINQEHVVV